MKYDKSFEDKLLETTSVSEVEKLFEQYCLQTMNGLNGKDEEQRRFNERRCWDRQERQGCRSCYYYRMAKNREQFLAFWGN